MIELKISGHSVEEFFENWDRLVRYRTEVAAPEQSDVVEKQPEPEPQANPPVNEVPEVVAEANPPVVEAAPTPPAVETKKPRGRPKKETQPILDNVQAASPKEVPSDPIPDFLQRTPDNKVPAKEYTLDDIRDRVRLIIDAHTKRGHEMPVVVLYVQHLFKPFGIAKAAELKAEKWADFMAVSQGYLDGTVEVT